MVYIVIFCMVVFIITKFVLYVRNKKCAADVKTLDEMLLRMLNDKGVKNG